MDGPDGLDPAGSDAQSGQEQFLFPDPGRVAEDDPSLPGHERRQEHRCLGSAHYRDFQPFPAGFRRRIGKAVQYHGITAFLFRLLGQVQDLRPGQDYICGTVDFHFRPGEAEHGQFYIGPHELLEDPAALGHVFFPYPVIRVDDTDLHRHLRLRS